jgi:hypothetical protein
LHGPGCLEKKGKNGAKKTHAAMQNPIVINILAAAGNA